MPQRPLRATVTVEQVWQRVPGGSGTYVAELTRGSRHGRDPEGAALPAVLVVDLGDRDVEPVAEPVDDRTDGGALGLE